MFSDNKKLAYIESDYENDSKYFMYTKANPEYIKYTQFHKCWNCRCRYPYIHGVTYDNDYCDYEDDLYYKCPKCGSKWYIALGINFIGCFVKNIIEKFRMRNM